MLCFCYKLTENNNKQTIELILNTVSQKLTFYQPNKTLS